MNANGKIDRKALPVPDASAGSAGFEPPATDTEARLAALREEVLDRSGLGVADDFFRLGGHSLRLVRMQTRIRGAFRLDLPLAELFRVPTVRAMAAVIDSRGSRDEADDLVFMAGLLAGDGAAVPDGTP